MGWKGALAGSILGHWLFGPLGFIGSLIGAFAGHSVESHFFAGRARGGGAREQPRRDELADAYAVLGALRGDSDDVLRRKYRDLAKRNHPDALRARGLSEEMVGKATERMSRINAAWETIRRSRNLT